MFEEGVGLQTFTVGRSPLLAPSFCRNHFPKKGDSYNLKFFKYISILVLVLYNMTIERVFEIIRT